MTNLEIILTVYFSISGINLFATACWLMDDGDIEGVDGFWDWVIYSLLWIVQPIKAIIKFCTKKI